MSSNDFIDIIIALILFGVLLFLLKISDKNYD